MSRSLRLEELEVYKVAMEIGEIVWNIVIRWEYFEKKTLGVQPVDAADSIAFNISEGYGRFHYKENKNFVITAAGPLKTPLQESGRQNQKPCF
jgi:four helix bundle protein